MASQLPITRIQSSQKIEIATVDLVDGVDKVALIGAALQSRNLLVIASNQSAADGAKLTSLRLEAFSTLGDGTELAIDSNGVLVVASCDVTGTWRPHAHIRWCGPRTFRSSGRGGGNGS